MSMKRMTERQQLAIALRESCELAGVSSEDAMEAVTPTSNLEGAVGEEQPQARLEERSTATVPLERSGKSSRMSKELAGLAPWGWDARVGMHPPGAKSLRDFSQVVADGVGVLPMKLKENRPPATNKQPDVKASVDNAKKKSEKGLERRNTPKNTREREVASDEHQETGEGAAKRQKKSGSIFGSDEVPKKKRTSSAPLTPGKIISDSALEKAGIDVDGTPPQAQGEQQPDERNFKDAEKEIQVLATPAEVPPKRSRRIATPIQPVVDNETPERKTLTFTAEGRTEDKNQMKLRRGRSQEPRKHKEETDKKKSEKKKPKAEKSAKMERPRKEIVTAPQPAQTPPPETFANEMEDTLPERKGDDCALHPKLAMKRSWLPHSVRKNGVFAKFGALFHQGLNSLRRLDSHELRNQDK